MSNKHNWTFRRRFRERAFGWKSQPAIQRVKEAVSEIKAAARTDPMLGAEGAVLFLEKVSPALEQVDSSSGSIGTAVNNAVATLVRIIVAAPAEESVRRRWLERLWTAYQDDDIPYIETLGERWGELCGSPELASHWADELIGTCRRVWHDDDAPGGYFCGTVPCLSALLVAERHDELLALLDTAPYSSWHYRRYGVQALAALGRLDDALAYAEEGRGLNDSPFAVARDCEAILLQAGRSEEAYARYAMEANRATTRLTWFRNVARAYPDRSADDALDDLVAHTPGEEGKWFAAAKDAKRFDKAIELARRSPTAPQTLTRAARDFEDTEPGFAIEAGFTALYWMSAGYGYDITAADVLAAWQHTMTAAQNAGTEERTRARVRALMSEVPRDGFFARALARSLD